MKVIQCDRCKKVITKELEIPLTVEDKFRKDKGMIAVNISVGPQDLCLYCLISLLNQYDDRPTLRSVP